MSAMSGSNNKTFSIAELLNAIENIDQKQLPLIASKLASRMNENTAHHNISAIAGNLQAIGKFKRGISHYMLILFIFFMHYLPTHLIRWWQNDYFDIENVWDRWIQTSKQLPTEKPSDTRRWMRGNHIHRIRILKPCPFSCEFLTSSS